MSSCTVNIKVSSDKDLKRVYIYSLVIWKHASEFFEISALTLTISEAQINASTPEIH
jgi:hypothetical protein